MTIVSEPGRGPTVQRVRGILLQPTAEWRKIDGEPASVGGLYRGYIAPLAAIPAVCGLIGMVVVGYSIGLPGVVGASAHTPLIGGIVSASARYLFSLAMVYVLALIIDALAPTFGGQKDFIQALKLSAYSETAAWIAGVLLLIPALSQIAALLSLYGLYLLYRGLPILMKTPQEKALPYTGLILLAAFVLTLVVGAVLAPLALMGGAAGLVAGAATPASVSSGGTRIDRAKLEAASRQLEASAAALQAQATTAQSGQAAATAKGAAASVDPEVLKSLLPANVGGLARTEIFGESAGSAGMGGSHAEARYGAGDATMTVEVTDTAALAGLAGMAGAFDVNSSKETATGYEKVATVDGRMTTEEYDRASRHGKYGVLAGGRFMVRAEGDRVSIDDLKAAVNAVGVVRVEQLAGR